MLIVRMEGIEGIHILRHRPRVLPELHQHRRHQSDYRQTRHIQVPRPSELGLALHKSQHTQFRNFRMLM